MFDDVRKYIESEVEPTAVSTKEFLNKLNGARRRNKNSIAKSEEQVKLMKDETKYVASIKPDIILGVKNLAKTSLFNKALEALRTNKEFDDPMYRLPLFEAIEDDDTYLVKTTGSGFNSKVSVTINLDKSAGRLNMWADAVKAARKSLGVTVPRRDSKMYEKMALSASKAWARHYAAKDEKYQTMIETRLELSAKPAPFWSILNFGTPPGMKSDRGGYPTPKNKNTNFVGKADEDVLLAVRGIFDTAKEEYKQAFADYNKYLEEATARQERLDTMHEKIKFDLSVVRRLESSLGLEKQDIDRGKLEKAVIDVKNNLSNKKRFEIGSGKRKRISRKTIQEFLSYG